MTNAELITAVREHARRNYNRDGWDILVECWDDSDIIAAITPNVGIGTPELAIQHIAKQLKLVNDYRTDIQNEAF